MPLPKQVLEAAAAAEAHFSNPSIEEVQTIEPSVQQAPTSEVPTVADDWKKRFVNYKKGTDETIRQLRAGTRDYESLKKQVSTLKAENEALRVQTHTPNEEALELFSEDEVTTFNKMIDTKTSAYETKIQELETEAEERRKAEEIEDAKEAHRNLVQAITDAVPEFQTIDIDPRFREFLEDVDDFGQIRMDLLRKAQANRDVSRIVNFYNEFKQLTLAPQETQQTINPRELQQIPQSVNTSPQPTQAVRPWRNEDIQALYRDIALGKISEEEGRALEKEMLAYVNTHRR